MVSEAEEGLLKSLHDVSGNLAGFVSNVQDELVAMMRARNATTTGPQGLVENVQAFYAAVNWTESWIRGLLLFHVLMYVAAFVTRKRIKFQIAQFLILCGLVRGAERANGYLASHWKEFSTQNYFDSRGVFLGTVWCGPLIVLLLLMVMNFYKGNVDMMVVMKRAQLKQQMKERQKKE